MRSTDVIAKQCSLSKQQSEKEAGLPATPLASTVTLVLPVFYVVGAQLFPCSATVRQPDIVFGITPSLGGTWRELRQLCFVQILD